MLQWVENPRLNQLARVASTLGSPTRHLISQGTPIEDMYPCEACDRLTTNLFSISRVMKNPNNNNAATKTLEDIIAPKRCQQEPATKGNSKHEKNATRQITDHTVKNTTAEVCYLCAAPTIIEEHRAQTPTQDRTNDKEILLHDIRQIAQCTNSPSSLDFLFKKRDIQNTTPK